MSLTSLIASGTKVWLDSIDPDFVRKYRALGATGATSNPIIISDLIRTGRYDDEMAGLMEKGIDDEGIAWHMTDKLVRDAQEVFLPVHDKTRGNDGYVSFELDPLLEDPRLDLPQTVRTERYIQLGKEWSAGHRNRMIKVPATPAGLEALEELAGAGVTLNVTLIFTQRQYELARAAIWTGAQRREDGLDGFKSVYSIFISRVDVYTDKHVPELSPAAQGMVGIVNAKRMWLTNREFWKDKNLRLDQEIIFASTGTKKDSDSPDKYVEALAGADIQTNPPKTNEFVETSGKTYVRTVDQMPPKEVLDEIDLKVDMQKLEDTLMREGIAKFADPHHALLKLIKEKRQTLVGAS
jgi:transaldolase